MEKSAFVVVLVMLLRPQAASSSITSTTTNADFSILTSSTIVYYTILDLETCLVCVEFPGCRAVDVFAKWMDTEGRNDYRGREPNRA